jgi:hypothetical protein
MLPVLRLGRPADLLAVVPFLLGFHPAESLVLVGLRSRRVIFIGRVDLPPPDEPQAAFGRELAQLVRRQAVRQIILIGYGSAARVDQPMAATRAALPGRRVVVWDALRVADGRYWSYTCAEPTCCSPDGTPFDASANQVAATAAQAGMVALPDRAALEARVAPVDGPARAAMQELTAAAVQRLTEAAEQALVAGRAAALCAGGEDAVQAALARCRAGGVLADGEIAWLTVVLRLPQVWDYAGLHITGEQPHIDLWTDVVRRAMPEFVAPPAVLLALAAWRAGDGALAAVAVDRALAADPTYPLALLLDTALRYGLPPSILDSWLNLSNPRRRRRRSAQPAARS